MGKIIRDWNGNEIGIEPEKGENPMIIHGYGPAGRKCKDCVFYRVFDYHNKRYGKCEKRGITHGAGTDHKASWPACKKFEEGGKS